MQDGITKKKILTQNQMSVLSKRGHGAWGWHA